MQRIGLDKRSCETQCKNYSWCRGIDFGGGWGVCRLLGKEQPEPIDGWTAKDYGNWAEPAQWKKSPNARYKCYEMIITGRHSNQ